MIKTIDVNKSGAPLSELVSLALSGTEVILAEGDRPLVRLVPVETTARPRMAGLNRGAMVASEDFDAALPESFWMGGK
jgi:antitoxin (DNA-binding transcriptional repressor) of toxin-antitoxin stability system